jgi:dynein heavy chain
VLFINESDVGWLPFFVSWLVKYKKNDLIDSSMQLAQTTYMSEGFMEDLKSSNWDYITPVCDMQKVQSLTTIIDFLIKQLTDNKEQAAHMKNLLEENDKEKLQAIYDGIFVFAGMWAIGAGMNESKSRFSGGWKSGSQKIKFPDTNNLCFDFYLDPILGEWVLWDEKVKAFDTEYEGLFANLVVPTAETTRQAFLMDLHVKAKKGVLYVGKAGTGKTVNINNFLSGVDPETVMFTTTSFNSYTDSRTLQDIIEGAVGSQTRTTKGPPTGKVMIYFLDDLNMPQKDKYLTQAPICLIRQIIDYELIYNREALEESFKLVGCIFFGCMNPKSGSFAIDLRLSRHMTLVSCLTAEKDILRSIY